MGRTPRQTTPVDSGQIDARQSDFVKHPVPCPLEDGGTVREGVRDTGRGKFERSRDRGRGVSSVYRSDRGWMTNSSSEGS